MSEEEWEKEAKEAFLLSHDNTMSSYNWPSYKPTG